VRGRRKKVNERMRGEREKKKGEGKYGEARVTLPAESNCTERQRKYRHTEWLS
jgi:hypothetical protein